MTQENHEWMIRVYLAGKKKPLFLTSDGGLNRLKIHAALYTEEGAKTEAEHLPKLNPGVVESAVAVKRFKD